jgi:hypothetical protein
MKDPGPRKSGRTGNKSIDQGTSPGERKGQDIGLELADYQLTSWLSTCVILHALNFWTFKM